MSVLDRPARVALLVGIVALAGLLLSSVLVGVPATSTVAGMGGMGADGTTGGMGADGMTGGMGADGMTGGMGMTGWMGVSFLPFLLFPLVAVLAFGYVGVRVLVDDEPVEGSADTPERTDPIARIQRQYTDGELTETELELALERELEGGSGGANAIDRRRFDDVDPIETRSSERTKNDPDVEERSTSAREP